MTKLDELYCFAESRNIPVDLFELKKREALSFLEPDGSCFIAIDPNKLKDELDELMKLAHELGHCETGSFYNRWATCDLREKHECRAQRWAIKKFLPKEELAAAILDGRYRWEIAESFGVPESLVERAIEYYNQTESTLNPVITYEDSAG